MPAIVVPTAGQLAWQQAEFGLFVHFGLNSFHGREWSDGTLRADSFDPVDLDAGAWVRSVVDVGARHLILTAKHHDGFCLWQTETTGYSVASSPWRNGRGDVVAEVAEACREAGIGFGVYLSPWDRNAECYDDPQAYSEFYARQLTELCTRYGPLVEIWFDGAGSDGYVYDWERIVAVIDEHQPDAMVFNMGRPTIRWVGNEDGLASDPVEYVVGRTQLSNYTAASMSTREAAYLPPECDVSIRRGWFWHPDDEPKTVDHLMAIMYGSIGMGANLLLNVPPTPEGVFDPADVRRLREWRAEWDRRFGSPIEAHVERDGAEWRVRFTQPVRIDHLRLREHLTSGQRITAHEVIAGVDAAAETIARGLTVGQGRIHAFPARDVTELRIRVSGHGAKLAEVTGFLTGHETIPQPPEGYEAPTDAPLD
ncbi:alpha-L-fucosidase [Microbacterium esteraromaticum]|uniref:alpha-L-fucosidase n=1 Tax=Microbacterium esteraromaticum TaxID=57043 RepID=A0A7D8A8Q9_9MICO|nr:alpha-L-fucosidase [Microbacterium esteraromaticum]QMU97240.1 alpha-L-fucosidase [Microbacterium esteraromaticum]